jgi:hypothetical protein
VFEISSKLKAKKDVTVSTAKDILEKRNDKVGIDILYKLENPIKEKGKRKPKKVKLDDLCDTTCQSEAFLGELEKLEYKYQQGYVLMTKSVSKKKKAKT